MSTINKSRTGAFALLLGSALTISGALAIGPAKAQAPATATPAKPKLVITGLVDGYFAFLGTTPKGVASAPVSGMPLYTVRNETPALSLAEVNLTQAPASTGGFGYKATLIAGDTAELNVGGIGTNTKESRFENVQQLYATWAFSKGGSVDFGKFYTPFGYEVVESNANFNYTRSIPFTALCPIYHAGFRVTSPVYSKALTLTGLIVNSISDTAEEGLYDDNNDKGFIGSANWTDPAGKYVLVETLGYSRDKNVGTPFGPTAATDKLTLSDTDATFTYDPKDTIGLNYTYRVDDTGTAGKVTSNGYAVYYRRQIDGPTAVALRYSGDQSKNATVAGSPSTKPQEFTATYEIKSSANWLTRFEYQHDTSNVPLFVDSANNITKKNQDIALVGVVYTFGP